MAALSGTQVAQIAYEAGFRGQDLINMVAIAKRESGWQPDAHRSDQPKSSLSGDRGLFQINSVWDAQLIQAGIISSKQDLFDPLKNARAAAYVASKQGLAAWGMGSNGWAAGGDPFRGTNRDEAQQAVNQAQQQGLLGQPYAGGSGSGNFNVSGLGNTSTAGTGPVSLPSDTALVANDFGVFAVFQPSANVFIYYSVPLDGSVQFDMQRQVERVSNEEWNRRYPNAVGAGDATELGTTAMSFGSFQGQWDAIINQVMGFNNPARNDPEVLRVIAELAGRPDMSEAELQNRLQATQWFQQRTSEELEYNSLSEAEKQKRRDETAARMVATVMQYAGENVDAKDPRVANYLEQVASGKMGFGAFTEVIKDGAEANAESPWSRQVRDEQEAQRQRPIDIENTAQRIREQAERWGLQWSPQTISQWAKDMVEKKLSDEDLNKTFRDQAAVLYPWKSPEIETATAAAPWLETYRRVMETTGSLFEPDIQKALTAGQGVWEFEQELKKKPDWLATNNGQQSVEGTVAQMSRMMGFA